VAAGRPVREALMPAGAVASPLAYLQRQARWHPAEIVFWLATLAPYWLFPDYLVLASQIAITALFALSLDLILGYAGIVSLGHAAFFGLGAYTAGLAAKHGVTVANAPGTIDADYRGEVGVILINLGKEPFRITRGMRIAQLVVARHARAVWREVSELDRTARGAGGFGSTGVTVGSAKNA